MTHTDTLPASPELYGLVTLVFDASPTGAPTNPDEVTLVVTFTAPDGSTYTRNGFYYQAYEYAEWYDPPKYAKYERGEPYYVAGATDWRCRFLPASEGDYTWSAVLTHQDGVENASGAFTVAASGNLGPVQLGATPAHPLKLAGSDEGFFPIGVTCGHYTQATVAYDLSRVAGAANFLRFNISYMGYCVDGNLADSGTTSACLDAGLGDYTGIAQLEMWRLEAVLDLCEAAGVYLFPALVKLTAALPGGGSWTVTATDENGAEVYRELRHLRQGSQWEIPLPEFDSYLMLRATCAAQGARLNGGDWILPQNKAR